MFVRCGLLPSAREWLGRATRWALLGPVWALAHPRCGLSTRAEHSPADPTPDRPAWLIPCWRPRARATSATSVPSGSTTTPGIWGIHPRRVGSN